MVYTVQFEIFILVFFLFYFLFLAHAHAPIMNGSYVNI